MMQQIGGHIFQRVDEGQVTVGPSVRPPHLDNPALWDAITAARPRDVVLASIPKKLTDDIAQTRRAMLRFQSPDIAERLAAFQLLQERADTPLARGLYILFLAQMGHHEQACALKYTRRGLTALDSEEASYAHAGLAVSHGALGRHMDAYAHIMMSLDHAQAAGMADRLQYLEFLRYRTLNNTDQPEPENNGEALLHPMPAPRRYFGRQGHADGHMSVGDYRTALIHLGPAAADDIRTANMRAVLNIFVDFPLLRRPDPSTEWGVVAQGLQRLFSGNNDTDGLLQLTQDPTRTWGRMITALMLARGEGYDRHARRTLGTMPVRLDLRAVWVLFHWIIDHRAGRTNLLVQHVRALEDVCALLRTPRNILLALARLEPELYVLLCNTPAQIDGLGDELPRLPILIGDSVLYEGRSIPAPGRTGRVYVTEALGLPDDVLDPTEKRRFRNKMSDEGVPGSPVNLGAVVSLLRAAQPGGDAMDKRMWEDALSSTMHQFSVSVQEVLHHYPL